MQVEPKLDIIFGQTCNILEIHMIKAYNLKNMWF